MTQDLKQKLVFLAEQNEVSQFLDSDPSQFIRWYKNPSDCEIASFIAAILSFGNRKQFIPKIKQIFELADKSGGIYKWIKTSSFLNDFCDASYGCSKHLICLRECVLHKEVSIHIEKLFVVDDKKAINVFLKLADSVQSL